MARRFRSRPSVLLHIPDDYAAFCFDEACGWMLAQMEEGKRPFFADPDGGRQKQPAAGGNAQTVACLAKLGAEVRGFA